MNNLPVPAAPDLARAIGDTKDELISYFKVYYEADGAHFNYLAGTRSIKQAYKGLHDLDQLLTGCTQEKTKQGKKANEDAVRLAAPVAFGRKTQVFDLPRRRFAFGRDLHAAYRIPFFFVEDGTVKLYYLQPRKSWNLTFDQLCMVATIHKRYLLDTEFYGQPSDVEYVDIGADPRTGSRKLTVRNLNSLPLWPHDRLSRRLTLIAEALDYIRNNDVVARKRRPPRRPAPDMPLFD